MAPAVAAASRNGTSGCRRAGATAALGAGELRRRGGGGHAVFKECEALHCRRLPVPDQLGCHHARGACRAGAGEGDVFAPRTPKGRRCERWIGRRPGVFAVSGAAPRVRPAPEVVFCSALLLPWVPQRFTGPGRLSLGLGLPSSRQNLQHSTISRQNRQQNIRPTPLG